MVKVRLLSHGGFWHMRNVALPVVVSAKVVDDEIASVSSDELLKVGAVFEHGDEDAWWTFFIGLECEIVDDANLDEIAKSESLRRQTLSRGSQVITPSNPQTTDITIHCNGIEEVTLSQYSGFKQMVTLTDACVEAIIEQVGPNAFFNAFTNEELAEHLRKYGYEVTKND